MVRGSPIECYGKLRIWNGRFARPREMGYAGAMASTEAPPTGLREGAQPRRSQPPAFPGCKPVRLPRTEIERFEGRLEYWDAATETAWISSSPLPATSARRGGSRDCRN